MPNLGRSVAGLSRIMEDWGCDYADALKRQDVELTNLLTDLEQKDWKPIMMSGNPEQGITILFE